MAEKGWTAQVATAAGMAAGIGAAQLGLGYGLGVVVWPAIPTVDDSVWLGSLGWATWIAASSTVLGAVTASRLRPGERRRLPANTAGLAGRLASASASGRPGGPWRFALAAAAAIGALLAVALIAIPARSAVRADTFSPQTIAGGYALVGVLLGLAIAYWAVVSRPVAANLIATTTWLWALAATAIVVELTTHRASATYLTSWQFTDPDNTARYGTLSWPSSLLTLLAALVIGAIAALPAVSRGDLGVGAATSGAVGPLLVAAAFFVLAPRLTAALGSLESAYLIAPYAVLTGLAGSAMTVAIGQPAAERSGRSKPLRRGRPATSIRKAAKRTGDTNGTATGVAAVPASNGAGAGDQPTTGIPRGRPRVKGRLRRRGADPAADEPAVPTGRAKAPSISQPSSAAPPPERPAPERPAPERPAPERPAPDRLPSAAGSLGGEAAAVVAAGSAAPGRSGTGTGPAARTGPVPMQAPPSAPAPIQPAPKAPEPISAPKPPGAPAPRPAPAANNPLRNPLSAAPIASTPTNAKVRSTVAPPPPDPPIAKINPSATKPPTPPAGHGNATAASPSPAIPPGAQTKAQPSPTIPPSAQTKAQPSPTIPPSAQTKDEQAGAQSKDGQAAKSAPAKRAPAKRTTAKTTSARAAKSAAPPAPADKTPTPAPAPADKTPTPAPADKAPAKSTRAKADPKPDETAAQEPRAEASPLWVEDSEPPPPPKKRRFGRRSNGEG